MTKRAKKNSKEKQANYSKRGKTRVSKARLVLVLKLIGREHGASFFFGPIRERSKAKLEQSWVIFDTVENYSLTCVGPM